MGKAYLFKEKKNVYFIPIRKESIDDSVSKRIDGQFRYPQEIIFPAKYKITWR